MQVEGRSSTIIRVRGAVANLLHTSPRLHMRSLLLSMAFLLSAFAVPVRAARGEPVDFNRDVQPLLSRHCFKCHGPDDKARKAKVRLDVRDAVTAETKGGHRPIVPGKPDESELV